ncbi:uncharacterized protein LACBIDRAFT_301282 [Laccaria bicolor S238N-H82]|uniref:Predicted protein n=1 Tax=Laccaria bicolor (strain S238N-H82 / ATCC MYA-4686) TaxID=486041 RepID=B0CRS5_LACBS|nr:uncharacterized protein LACBIDRAFT_301282 [Laccaria bicolor S238N-H82]EDR15249.1 predicted protein [Laccaria bicolor S238N-H82]|eukprot:XP_001873457.1 predicted protein [Laccaria bicolor S238N-H82]
MSDLSKTSQPIETVDPIILYSRSLHEYTLRLWTESRRVAEQNSSKRREAKVSEEEAEKEVSGCRNPPASR